MGKKILIISLSLLLIPGLLLATGTEKTINQKVIRKDIKIIPKSTDNQLNLENIKEIDTNTTPIKPPVTEVIAPTQPTPPVTNEEIKPFATNSPGTLYPRWLAGAKFGPTAPGFGVLGDLYMLPVKISEKDALYTRVGLGFVNGSRSGLAGQLSEILYLKSNDPNIAFFGGAGLNLPFVSQGKLGYNLIIGAEHKVNLFNQKNEAITLESGLGNFSAGSFITDGINLLIGYKFEL